MNLKEHLNIIDNTCILNIKVVPNARKNEFFSVMDNGVLKIRIAKIPENGKANDELIKFISKELGVKKQQVEILSGLTDKNKIVKIDF